MTSIPGGGTVLQQFPGGGGGNSKFHTTSSPSSPLMQHLPFLGMIQQNNGKFGESKVNCDDSSLVKFDNNISSLEEDHCGNDNDDHSMNSDRFRLLLFNHKNTMMNNTTIHLHNHNSSIKNTSLNQEHVISKGFIKIGGEKQPTQKNNHDRVDNYFGKVNKEHGMADIDSIIKPKWLKPIVENQCDHKENRKFTKKYMDNFANINKKENSVKSKKIPKETNDSTRTNVKRKVVEKSEKTFNSVMLELFKERSTEMIDHNSNEEKTIESMYTRLTKAWNRFIFWWIKWKRDFTSNTIHQFLNSYDPVMRTFECIFLFFETFRIPYPIQYIVHRIRHFFYLMFQFVWTSAFLFEDNSEFERELLSHNNLRNDSQIYNSDPRYYYDDVNYYSQN